MTKTVPEPCRPGSIPPPPILRDLLAEVGVSVNGDRPWDMQVYDAAAYARILRDGSLGLGEAYMDGLWDARRLDEFFHQILRNDIDVKARAIGRWRGALACLRNLCVNRQAARRAFEVGIRHYDIGNDVFEAMLDPTMSYSCGYWQHATTLAQAQQHKLELVCRKLELRPGERLLDIGCGWGGLARHAAERFGVEVHGITVSHEQLRLARQRCAGLPVTIELCDYRALRGRFDKAVSVGMFEHVGPKNYARYFDVARSVLDAAGLFLLHTIGNHVTFRQTDPWIDRYIFPNGRIPSAAQLAAALEGRFLIEDWQNFGVDYDRTLMAWWENFAAAWPRLQERYEARFYRMWKYYLMSTAGYFRARQGQLWQLVLAGRGRASGYRSIRPVPCGDPG